MRGKQREMMLRSFDRVAPPSKDDDDFNGYLNEVQADLDGIAQEQSNKKDCKATISPSLGRD